MELNLLFRLSMKDIVKPTSMLSKKALPTEEIFYTIGVIT